MPGRKPVPTKLKIMRGNPGGRPLNTAEPSPPVSPDAPPPPEFLSPEAKAEWEHNVDLLRRAGLLSDMDERMLAGVCELYARWVKAQRDLAESPDGFVIVSQKGIPIQNPLVGILNRCWELYSKALVEFGMSPSSRSKVTVVESAPKENPFLKLEQRRSER